jgi:hypothetical protein
MFGSVFNKLHDLLTNRAAKDKFRAATNHVYDSLFDGPPDPWYTVAYYAVYRFFKFGNWYPSDIYLRSRWAIQRVRRGWSDRDVWSWSYRMNMMMPDLLRHLKANKHGYGMSMFPPDCEMNPAESDWAYAEKKWAGIIDGMIAGFDAGRRMEELDYEAELGPHPFRRPKNVCPRLWNKKRDEYMTAQRKLMDRDKELHQKGLALFAEHFWEISD